MAGRVQQLMALAEEGDEAAISDLFKEFGIRFGVDEEDPTIPVEPPERLKKGGAVKGKNKKKRMSPKGQGAVLSNRRR